MRIITRRSHGINIDQSLHIWLSLFRWAKPAHKIIFPYRCTQSTFSLSPTSCIIAVHHRTWWQTISLHNRVNDLVLAMFLFWRYFTFFIGWKSSFVLSLLFQILVIRVNVHFTRKWTFYVCFTEAKTGTLALTFIGAKQSRLLNRCNLGSPLNPVSNNVATSCSDTHWKLINYSQLIPTIDANRCNYVRQRNQSSYLLVCKW